MLGWFQTWDVIKGYNDWGHVFIACAGERHEVRSDEFEKIKRKLVSNKLTIGYVQKSKSRMQTWEPNFADGWITGGWMNRPGFGCTNLNRSG